MELMEAQLVTILFGLMIVAPIFIFVCRFVWYFVLFKFLFDGHDQYPAWKAAIAAAIFIK